jgi:hypothetical protein
MTVMIMLDATASAFEYLHANSLYLKFKLTWIRSSYRSYMNLFDLMSNLFIVSHYCVPFDL